MSEKICVYYYEKAGILEGRLNCVVGQETHVLTPEELEDDPARKELYKDALIWEGESPLMAGYPLIDEEKPTHIRLATRKELIDMGLDQLEEGEIIQGEEVVKIEKPNDLATWNKELGKWETDFEELPDGWKVLDREAQTLEFINQPNDHAKWNKSECKWETSIDDLSDGERLLEDGTIENVDRPIDDLEHRYEWSKETFTWENVITEEELTANYHTICEKLKEECLEEGFMYKGYQQKTRMLDITWLQCRLTETYNDGIARDQITEKYELLVDRSELKKVGWVFSHNEVLLLDVKDFKEMFDKGSSWSTAVYTAEEVLKSSPTNMNLTIDDFKATIAKFTDVVPYGYKESVVLKSRARRSLSVEPQYQPGHYQNPAHALGLTGAEVMFCALNNITLEEYAKQKEATINSNK